MADESVIQNSEASGDEEVIPLIFDNVNDLVATGIEGYNGHLSSPPTFEEENETINEDDMHIKELAHYTNSIRRTLRKRKPIQKMPYSLDRIRHRQLLKGYDVSNFDSVSDNIELPKGHTYYESNRDPDVSQTKNIQQDEMIHLHRTLGRRHIHLSEDEEEGEEGEEEREEDTSFHKEYEMPSATKFLNDIQDESGEWESDSDDKSSNDYNDNVLFRGRQVNLKTGYKGVLPKAAWKKALHEENERAYYKHKESYNKKSPRKGLAKRTNNKVKAYSEENQLIKELIANEEDRSEVNQNTETYLSFNNKEQLEDDDRLKSYFDLKYDAEYDSLSSGEDIEEDAVEGVELLTLNDEDKTALETLIIKPEFSNTNEKALGLKPFFRNSGMIDYMLAKRNIASVGGKKRTGFKRKRAHNKSDNILSDQPERISLMRKPVDSNMGNRSTFSTGKISNLTNKRNNPIYKKNYQKASREEATPKITHESIENAKGQSPLIHHKDKKEKPKRKLFTVAPGPFAELNRKALTFSTVVEELSDRFAVREHVKASDNSNFATSKNAKVSRLSEYSILNKDLFQSIMNSTTFRSPDVIVVTLNNKEYIISKLASDTDESLRAMFNNLVQFGGSDEEVKNMARHLSEFLFSWTSKNVYYMIDDFHKEFRAKVNLLRERAKPIHFFIIAVCQVMLLEASRYFSTPIAVKNKISEKLTDHIVSFFKLYSRCDQKSLPSDNDLIIEAVSILSFAVDATNSKVLLWKKLKEARFPPGLASLIVVAFPTKNECWSMVKTNQRYEDAISWIKFIGMCSTKPYDWDISNELALGLYEFFKSRKFQDFIEESRFENFPVVPVIDNGSRNSIFNTFLSILGSCTFKTSILEKLTPMSKIHDLSSASLFVNRLNLLLTLASQSKYSLERHFEDLLDQYILNKDLVLDHSIIKAMIEGCYSFTEISCRNEIPLRGKVIVRLWKKVSSYRWPLLSHIWRSFWMNFRSLMFKMKKSKTVLLHSFHQILHSMLNSNKTINECSRLLDIYLDNLENLETNWLQTHVMQLLVVKAKSNVTFLYYYCEIAKFLAEKQSLTWWSLFHYNNFDDNDMICIKYYSFLAKSCDDATFHQVKSILYQKILKTLLKQSSDVLIDLLGIMSERDKTVTMKIVKKRYTNDPLPLLKMLLTVLNINSYRPLFSSFLNDLREFYFANTQTFSYMKEILQFLNYNMIDVVRLYPAFIHMRSIFDIDDQETESSALREYLRSLACDKDRLSYLIERLFSSFKNALDIGVLMHTIEKSVEEGCFDSDINTLSTVLVSLPIDELQQSPKPLLITFFIFLKVLNGRIENECGRISKNDNSILRSLAYILVKNVSFFAKHIDLSEMKPVMNQYYRFFYSILRYNYGFPENDCMIGLLQNQVLDDMIKTVIPPQEFHVKADSDFQRRFFDQFSLIPSEKPWNLLKIPEIKTDIESKDYLILLKRDFPANLIEGGPL